jgi:hypothetical protein
MLNIHKLMISFVDICALSIILRESGRWTRFKGATKKVLFDDDSGVKSAIEGFKKLIKNQRDIEGPIALEQVLRSRKDIVQILTIAYETKESIADIAKGMDHVVKEVDHVVKDVDVLTQAESNRKLEQIAKDNQKKIIEALLGTNDLVQASKTVSNEHWNTRFKGSGSWLHHIPDYESWMNRESHASPLLLLTGEPCTGKSFLASVIIHELQSVHGHRAEGSTRAALVAYHFFPKSSDKSTKDQQPYTTALKCLAIQIAEQDMAYSGKISAWCDRAVKDPQFKEGNCRWFWEELKFVAPTRDLTYFLLLDGLDQCEDADQLLNILGDLPRSLPDSDRRQIRVIATGKAETFEENTFPDVPRIHVPQYNSPEIRCSIDQKLREFDLFQGQDPETLKWRNTIHDKLQELAGGDFFKVENVLDKINGLEASDGSYADLQKILNKAGQDRRIIAQNAIDTANEDMSANEIEELNELLIWVVFGNSTFDVSKLQAVLVSLLCYTMSVLCLNRILVLFRSTEKIACPYALEVPRD